MADDQRAADAHHRIAADLEVQVGRAAVDGDLQEIVDVHELVSAAGGPEPAGRRLVGRRCASAPAPAGCSGSPRVDVRQPAVRVGHLAVDDVEERRWSASVTGPRRPLPTVILSTERIGVTSAAVPTKNDLVGDVEHLARQHLPRGP